MSATPLISVVVPTYNAAPFIAEALESVRAQTLPPVEVIVVDDRSTDGTAELVQSLATGLPFPVRVVQSRRNSGGPARPTNVGIEQARSEWVAVLEQDDRMRPTRLATQAACLAAVPDAGLCVGRSTIIGRLEGCLEPIFRGVPQFQDLVPDAERPPAWTRIAPEVGLRALLRRQFAVSNSAMMFRKEVWREVGGYDTRVRTCTDFVFLRAVLSRHPIALDGAYVNEYRFHANSLNHRNGSASAWEWRMLQLAWCCRHREFAGESLWVHYWNSRVQLERTRRNGRWSTYAKRAVELLRTGAIAAHVRARLTNRTGVRREIAASTDREGDHSEGFEPRSEGAP